MLSNMLYQTLLHMKIYPTFYVLIIIMIHLFKCTKKYIKSWNRLLFIIIKKIKLSKTNEKTVHGW
jgi:hypothetical protein